MAMKKTMTLRQKAAYIKDYYTWPIVLTIVLALALAGAIWHRQARKTYDADLVYAGASYGAFDAQKAADALANLGDDVNHDGQKTMLFDQFFYGSVPTAEYAMTMTVTLEQMMQKGKPALYLLDKPRLYMVLRDGICPVPVSEWSQKEGDLAVNVGKSRLLSELGFPEEDLYLIVCRGSEDGTFDNACQIARAITETLD